MSAPRFKAYPAYKESGVEWLGEIPVHWERAPLYARYDVALGKMLDAKRVTGEFSGVYLRNVDVQWNEVNIKDLPEMDFAPWERARYLLRRGDVLVCEGGEVGRAAIWRGEIEECFYQKALHRVRPRSERETPRFFYYLLYMVAKRGVFVAAGNANTIDHLTAVQLRHYRFPFAPLDEQRIIAAFLDQETARIDALVAKKERVIERLREKRSALINRAVTKGLDPNVPVKDTGIAWLGEIPAHWGVLRFKLLFRDIYRYPTYYDIEYVPDGVPEVRGEALLDGSITVLPDQRYITAETNRKFARTVLQEGDLVMSVRGTMGKVGLVPQEFLGANITANLLKLSPKKQIATGRYLSWLLRSHYFLTSLDRQSPQTTIQTITMPQLATIVVPIPGLGDQRAIAGFLHRETAKIDALVAKVREAIDHLKELRTALISAAVTGKIDVRKEFA